MRTKEANFLNTETTDIQYGIKVFIDNKWIHAGDSKGVFSFDTKEDRDIKRKEVRKLKTVRLI